MQGFPKDYILPENRARWMKLVGNSVSVPVIEILAKAIIETGVFDKSESVSNSKKIRPLSTNLYMEQLTNNQRLKKANL
ncbi:MAG TPA: DNA cytosine methyltransferase [Pelobium sp.]|nr:DNA cytosine methyltransferase [Pelobium sp.]